MLCHESHLPKVQEGLDYLRKVGFTVNPRDVGEAKYLGRLWKEGW